MSCRFLGLRNVLPLALPNKVHCFLFLRKKLATTSHVHVLSSLLILGSKFGKHSFFNGSINKNNLGFLFVVEEQRPKQSNGDSHYSCCRLGIYYIYRY